MSRSPTIAAMRRATDLVEVTTTTHSVCLHARSCGSQAHYGDDGWRKRRECVRIIQRVTRGEVPKADLERLYSIAAALRASEGKK